jgi:hypothetical protein
LLETRWLYSLVKFTAPLAAERGLHDLVIADRTCPPLLCVREVSEKSALHHTITNLIRPATSSPCGHFTPSPWVAERLKTPILENGLAPADKTLAGLTLVEDRTTFLAARTNSAAALGGKPSAAMLGRGQSRWHSQTAALAPIFARMVDDGHGHEASAQAVGTFSNRQKKPGDPGLRAGARREVAPL